MKWSKFLFNCKRDSRITQKFQFLKNLYMTSKMFLDIVGVMRTSKLSILTTFQGEPHMSNRVNIKLFANKANHYWMIMFQDLPGYPYSGFVIAILLVWFLALADIPFVCLEATIVWKCQFLCAWKVFPYSYQSNPLFCLTDFWL